MKVTVKIEPKAAKALQRIRGYIRPAIDEAIRRAAKKLQKRIRKEMFSE
jgi:mRNA-degrading endonuclease RelE of RelBE toxin-antitoxin system